MWLQVYFEQSLCMACIWDQFNVRGPTSYISLFPSMPCSESALEQVCSPDKVLPQAECGIACNGALVQRMGAPSLPAALQPGSAACSRVLKSAEEWIASRQAGPRAGAGCGGFDTHSRCRTG